MPMCLWSFCGLWIFLLLLINGGQRSAVQKRMTSKYYALLKSHGYRDDLCSYCATAFAESLDPDDHKTDEEGKPMGPLGRIANADISHYAADLRLPGEDF